MTLQDIISALPSLSDAERRVVAQACLRLEGAGGQRRLDDLDELAPVLYRAVCDVLRERGMGAMVPPGEERRMTPRSPHFDWELFEGAWRWFSSVYKEIGLHGVTVSHFALVVCRAAADWIEDARHVRFLCDRLRKVTDRKVHPLINRLESIASDRSGLSVKSVLRALSVEGDLLLEHAFPGYRRSGMLRMVVKGRR